MPRSVLIALLLPVVAACSVPHPPADLAAACQFKACVCSDTRALMPALTAGRSVEWRANGDAGCPEGYALRLKGN
jgi:hypothetical protein